MNEFDDYFDEISVYVYKNNIIIFSKLSENT